MADVTLTYKGATIAELSDSGSKTLRTAGKFCEADIGVEYVKPSGGGGAGSGNELPQFFVYAYDDTDRVYVDKSGSRVTYKGAKNLLKNGLGALASPIKSIYGNDVSLFAAHYCAQLLTSGIGGNQNLISDGNKVSSYNALHFGFSSKNELNSEDNPAISGLIPTTFNASGTTPNYVSKYNGYTITQVTIELLNPSNEDFICKSVFVSASPLDGIWVTGNSSTTGVEHCI